MESVTESLSRGQAAGELKRLGELDVFHLSGGVCSWNCLHKIGKSCDLAAMCLPIIVILIPLSWETVRVRLQFHQSDSLKWFRSSDTLSVERWFTLGLR